MLLLPEDEPPLAPPVVLGLLGLCVEDEEPLVPDEPVEEPLMPELELEGLELDDVPPVALDFWPASHSERESLPSWSLSSLSNSPEELDEDDEPPAAEDVLEGDDVLPAEDEDGEDDLLLCDIEGEALEPDELFDASAA